MTTARCPNCGALHSTIDSFCSECGEELLSGDSRQEPRTQFVVSSRYRDFGILGGIIIATVVVYNLLAYSYHDNVPAQIPSSSDQFERVVRLGNNFMDGGMYDHAVTQYRQALQIDSSCAEVIVDLGACYHAIGEHEEAINQFKRALLLEPDHPVALFNMGVVQLTLADTAAARIWWNKYLEIAGDLPEVEMVRRRLEEL